MPAQDRHNWRLLFALPLLTIAAPSLAQETWKGSLGAGALYVPDYLGSDDYETKPRPSLDLRYGERFYFNFRNGLGWNAIQRGNWRVSPFIGYTFGRDDDHDLRYLDQVDGGATLGLQTAYHDGAWVYSAAAKTSITGDVDGHQLTLKAQWRNRLSEQLFASLGPSLTYSSEKWTDDMFGISSQGSARSGLAAYEADNGYLRIGLAGSLSYRLTPTWSITGLVGVSRLTGDAKDSPIVNDVGDATQAIAGAFVSYHF